MTGPLQQGDADRVQDGLADDGWQNRRETIEPANYLALLLSEMIRAYGNMMKLTIIQVGECPEKLRHRFDRYPDHFQRMFGQTGADFTFGSALILDGAPFPEPGDLEGIIITGSAAGVYDTPVWINPLRDFIRRAYAKKTPMLGVCFGHQIMADALGGDVRKSEKGWGLGRGEYQVRQKPAWLNGIGENVAIAASHQDQVITPPADAEVFLASEFTPNAGLIYGNGAAISIQPHPEFDAEFASALVELRRDNPITNDQADTAVASLENPLDSIDIAAGLASFFKTSRI